MFIYLFESQSNGEKEKEISHLLPKTVGTGRVQSQEPGTPSWVSHMGGGDPSI